MANNISKIVSIPRLSQNFPVLGAFDIKNRNYHIFFPTFNIPDNLYILLLGAQNQTNSNILYYYFDFIIP